jgi:uncharacterized protein
MKVLLFSDVHCDWKALGALLEREADAYICAGDVVTWARSLEQAGEMLGRRRGKVWILPGNHESASDIQSISERFGLVNVHDTAWEMGGVRFAALGYSNPTPFNTPGEYSEAELASRLGRLGETQPEVLICHCPPKGSKLDRAGEGQHFGSTAVAEAIAAIAPKWFFCGHIHEAEGQREQFGTTTGINLGKRGYLLELDRA